MRPFFTALLGFLFLNEKISLHVWIAIGIATIGIIIIALGNTEKSSLIGGIWNSETDLSLSEEKWFESIYLDLSSHDNPTVVDIGASTGCLSLFNKVLEFLKVENKNNWKPKLKIKNK